MFFYNVTSSFLERKQIHWIHETGLGIIIGFFIGWILEASFNVEESFDGDSFFAIILPCIVFAGGYNMRKR
jgi:NhaP-type Na+/H+ or K+/H+ antiporter